MSAWVIISGRRAKAVITKDEEYGRLAQDYRRLSELAGFDRVTIASLDSRDRDAIRTLR